MTAFVDLPYFTVDQKEGLWDVWIEVRAKWPEYVAATTAEEARAKVAALIASNSIDAATEPDDFEIVSVVPQPPLYRVLRDGRAMQVSHVEPGDLPREPNRRGF